MLMSAETRGHHHDVICFAIARAVATSMINETAQAFFARRNYSLLYIC
jgi:hypothetical protein